ncbi:MAG: YdeI/OmpD-associated family protein [Bacteroidia bacterium]|nr:YdeI/OmpD-associated family protein [Bacteroidia bacterium]
MEKNHKTVDELWLRYYKKPSGKPRIPYSDAVEEALCFGWIDGKIKRINADYYIQRFTPRRKGSRWSKYNIDRVKKLIKEGLMTEAGLKSFNELKLKPELAYENRSDGDPVTPDDLLTELKKNKTALKNFVNFSNSNRRMDIDWLNSAKKPETRSRRIIKIVDMAAKDQKPGMI